ncbi:MAG: EthD family reductase [Arenicellales bacterium]
MFKAIILLKRKSEASHSEFKDWWLDQHAPLARQLPGLLKAIFNLVSDEGQSNYDGISELWFESRHSFEDAYASEVGQQVAADSMAHVSERTRLLCDEFTVKE